MSDFKSRWVVDRKIWQGALFRLQFTACGNPRCRAGCPEPTHGPYWFKMVRIADGRDFLRYIGRDPPWPLDNPPPSLEPAEVDPTSRSQLRRAAREKLDADRAARQEARAQESRAGVKTRRAATNKAARAVESRSRRRTRARVVQEQAT